MGEIIFWAIGAFFLYLVVLPLVGFAITFGLKVFFPYALGSIAAYWAVSPGGVTTPEAVAIAMIGSVWLAVLWKGRSIAKSLEAISNQWDNGHYWSLGNTLLLGAPLRKAKRRC